MLLLQGVQFSGEIRLGEVLTAGLLVVSVTLAYSHLDKRITLIEAQIKPFIEWFEEVTKKGFFAVMHTKEEVSKSAKAGGE